MRLNLPVTNSEVELFDGKTIVSTTDLKGKITYANRYFIETCGYTEQELIGAPHNILRHLDMPVEAYADLWKTLKSGLPWSGIVKNRCKNGDHYWVVANVTPVVEDGCVTGYMSVRTKPSRTQVEQASALYKEIKDGNPKRIGIFQGKPVSTSWWSRVAALKNISLARRIAINMGAITLLCGVVAFEACYVGSLWLAVAGCVAIAALALTFWHSMYGAIITPLKDATFAAKVMAGGDMTTLLEIDRHDEVGQLQRLLRQLNINLSSIIGDVRSNFQQIVTSTSEVSRENMDLSARTESQACSLEETSASMEQLTSSVEQNADNTREVDHLSSSAAAVTERTGGAVAQVVTAMQEINAASARIADIIGLIDGIAFQTNILALNAAVEAARAGEQGRGFAVVAGEVRNLAQRSSTAAKEIRGLIAASSAKVDAGLAVANEAGCNVGEMIRVIKQVAAIMNEIHSATDEQSAGIGQVKDAILQMDEVTQQNAAMVEKAAASACALQDHALAVARALLVFKLRADAEFMPAPAAPARVAVAGETTLLRIVHSSDGARSAVQHRLGDGRPAARTRAIANGVAVAALEAR